MFNIFNSILWAVAVIFLVGGGIYFTFYLKGIQFSFLEMIKSFSHKKNSKISPFQSLTMALAARIGVGSLAGIALAIYIGGPGTIFWIWVSSILTSVNAFSESLLGIIYKEKDGDIYKGGPAYYIDKGLGNKKLALTYAFLIMFAYIVGFMTIQANTISASVNDYFKVSPFVTGIILAIVSGISIIKGVKGIVSLTSKLVPVMGLVYLILGIYIIFDNFLVLGDILLLILNHAFNIKSFGVGVLSSFIIGVQRGVFSTEAGLGSGAIASSTTDDNNPVHIGLVQVVGIYFVSFVICTTTAIIILTSDYLTVDFGSINGIELTQYALSYHLGDLGIWVLIFSIISFAFSTIIAGYYYGESNLKYFDKRINNQHLLVLKIVTLSLLVVGSVVRASILWTIVDILVAFMSIINMYSILRLRKVVKKKVLEYKRKL